LEKVRPRPASSTRKAGSKCDRVSADARLEVAITIFSLPQLAPSFDFTDLEDSVDQPLVGHLRRREVFRILCSFIFLF
jgi:hypothetical protein